MKNKLKFETAFRRDIRVPTAVKEIEIGHSWPDTRWQKDPVGFSYYILGEQTWDKQTEILEGIRDSSFGIVKAGRKVSKSNSIAKAAIWFFSSFPEAKVVIMSTTMPQLQQIIWYSEIRRLVGASGTCYDCKIKALKDGVRPPRPCKHSHVIPGAPAEKAGTGFYAQGSRYIVGRTPKDAIALQGTSGHSVLYLLDEASGIKDNIFTTIEGNLGGIEHGGYWCFLNPNKPRGFCYTKFKKQPAGVKLITVASTDSPNYKEGKTVIPGLASRAYVDKMAHDYGVDSAEYKIHVLGEYAEGEDGKIINLSSILAATERWSDTPAEGLLRIGLDPAGDGGLGDDSVFTAVRGKKMLENREFKGLTPEGHLDQLKRMIEELALPNETPHVTVDRDGSIGAPLYRLLRDYSESHSKPFTLTGVRASSASGFDGEVYHLNRDGLWACLSKWIRKGGAIINNERLADELHFPSWTANNKSLLKCTPKKEFIAELKRSPDRADSLALAVWEPTVMLIEDSTKQNKPIDPSSAGEEWWAIGTYQPPPLV